MRLRIAVFALCLGMTVTEARSAAPSFPYKAQLTADNVYVRSGPGDNYYPTEKLQAGAEVEVYRHDPGGWCAIRPVRESFSWVSGRYLKPGENGLATVTGDSVAAQVGSQFSDIRDVVQVRLNRGEAVELRGTKQLGTGGDSAMTWHKIAPPAGEFRFIDQKFIDPDFPHRPAKPAGAAAANAGAGDAGDASRWTPAASPGTSAGGVAAPESSSPPVVEVKPTDIVPVDEPPAAPGAVRLPKSALPGNLSPEEFQTELDDINTELSVMLAEEVTVWNCEEISRRAQTLLDRAQTAVDRGRARAVVNRIAQADDIKRRYTAVNAVHTDTERRNRQLTELGRARQSLQRGKTSDDRFDGVGRLTRVVAPKVGAPRYALVDDQGSVRCYVSPAPGVNMEYYVGRRVGINGIRGYIADQNAEHVTAKHVSPLEDRRLR